MTEDDQHTGDRMGEIDIDALLSKDDKLGIMLAQQRLTSLLFEI
jgi:hypothetical protein